jgi:hypothetical protein
MDAPPAPRHLHSSLLGASLCAATLLAACGGSGTSTATSAKAFLASAEHVCSVYHNKAHKLAPPLGFNGVAELVHEQQALREGELSGLRAVAAPRAMRVRYDRYLSDMRSFDELIGTIVNKGAAKLLALARSHPTIQSQRELELARIRAFVRSRKHRLPSRSAAQRATVGRITRIERGLNSEARAIGLGECAKNLQG